MDNIKKFNTFSTEHSLTNALKLINDARDVFQDVIDEFGMDTVTLKRVGDVFVPSTYPDNAISFLVLQRDYHHIVFRITFKGNKSDSRIRDDVGRYIRNNLTDRYRNMGLDMDVSHVNFGVHYTALEIDIRIII